MTRTRLLFAVVSALVVAGCGGDDTASPPPEPTSPTAADATIEASPLTSAGSIAGAGATYAWPDGLTVTVTKVEHLPRDWASNITSGQEVVRVTLDVTNNSPADIPFVPGSRVATVQYGDARYDAGSANGPRYDDPAEYRRKSIDSEQPNLLPAGKKVTFWNSGLVPADQLGVLAIEVELPSEEGIRDPYTFTDAHTLLKTVN